MLLLLVEGPDGLAPHLAGMGRAVSDPDCVDGPLDLSRHDLDAVHCLGILDAAFS